MLTAFETEKALSAFGLSWWTWVQLAVSQPRFGANGLRFFGVGWVVAVLGVVVSV